MQILFAPAYFSFVFILALAINESMYLFQSPARRASRATRMLVTNVVKVVKLRALQIERILSAERA